MTKSLVLGNDELTIDASARFSLRTSKDITESGEVRGTRVTISIDGDITSDITDTTVAYSLEVIEELAAKRVRVEEDGTPIDDWDWSPDEVEWGPFVAEFETFDDPGAGESHWRYHMVIVLEVTGSLQGGGGSPVRSLRTSIREITVNGKVVKKIWTAECRAKSAETAESEVLAYKPSITDITGDVAVFRGDSAGARGEWTWEARKTAGGILSVECRVSITDSGEDYEADPQADAPPLFQRALEGVIVTEIDTTIRSFNADVSHFADHCSPDGIQIVKKHTLSSASPKAFVASEADAKLGIYTMKKREVYWSSGVSPAVVHAGDHLKIQFSDPPGDGAMGDS